MQNINVNIVPDNFPQTIRYSQGDIGRQFKINVTDFDIPVGATVKIQATKPSGFGFSVAGTVSDNSVTFTTTEEMTDEAGRFQAELQITAGGDVIGTANFLMVGERNPHPEGTTDGSQGTIIPELTLLVERVEKAASDILDMEVVATTLPAGSQATYSYDEDLNKATFGIPEGQAGAGAAGVVASAYSAAKTYKVGDYVLYNSNLYRCTTAITTAEAWTAAHWTQVVLADDVTDLKSDLDDMLHEVFVPFEGGVTTASGTWEGGVYITTQGIVRGIDYVEIASGYVGLIVLYRGNTYLGKINSSMEIDQIAGNWKQFSGTVNIKKIFAQFNADGFKINVNADGSVFENVYTNSRNYCKFYSYAIDARDSLKELIPINNGSWTGLNAVNFHFTYAQNRARPAYLIPISAGDVVKIDVDNGKYVSAVGMINGLCGAVDTTLIKEDASFVAGNRVFRVAFDGFFINSFALASNTSATIDVDTFTGSITVYRYSKYNNVEENNVEPLKKVLGGQRKFTTTPTDNVPSNNLATFVHITDVHGDKASFDNAYAIAKKINADALLATGDMVYYYSTDDFSYAVDGVADKKVDFLMCLGNHDGFSLTDAEQKAKYIDPFADDYGYVLDENASNPTYYYKDYVSKKLRVIVVNQFEYDGKTSTDDTRMNYTQNQVDFLVSALLNTPANYGVVIACHTPEKTPTKDNQFTKFFQNIALYSYNGNPSMTLLTELVDAFISKGTLNKTFNNLDGATPASVTVNADFSAVNTGVEFICYICGHLHKDSISYVPNTTNKQLLLNSVTTNSWYGLGKYGYSGSDNPYLTEMSDLQRIGGTPTQDSFNVYMIDRAEKTVRIVRIGANMPYDFDEVRDYMVIPYAD